MSLYSNDRPNETAPGTMDSPIGPNHDHHGYSGDLLQLYRPDAVGVVSITPMLIKFDNGIRRFNFTCRV